MGEDEARLSPAAMAVAAEERHAALVGHATAGGSNEANGANGVNVTAKAARAPHLPQPLTFPLPLTLPSGLTNGGGGGGGVNGGVVSGNGSGSGSLPTLDQAQRSLAVAEESADTEASFVSPTARIEMVRAKRLASFPKTLRSQSTSALSPPGFKGGLNGGLSAGKSER
eukprot:CAMPEP_0182541830 /NCGR_PEP_ID=MMETSP1323-20130603/29228_1 /TAXON_ID=236787 /ORGANISM="Florenciella parvula, Strain RCC1693" /LENGTH=168 /DNA_ID=CAMNT_0024752631 /DNA_START=54 /DNA_END=557 /DNA_ORIENTATION=+